MNKLLIKLITKYSDKQAHKAERKAIKKLKQRAIKVVKEVILHKAYRGSKNCTVLQGDIQSSMPYLAHDRMEYASLDYEELFTLLEKYFKRRGFKTELQQGQEITKPSGVPNLNLVDHIPWKLSISWEK